MKQNPKQTQSLLLLVLLAALLAVWKVPQWQVGNIPLSTEEKARIDAETSARVALIQGIGGLLFFVTAGVSWLNLRATQEKQVTERFSKAVEMIGNENNIHIRLGGIYALERIAKDSAKEHWQIMEILTAFVREKARLESKQEPFIIIDHFAEAYREPYDDSDEYQDDVYPVEGEWDSTERTLDQDYQDYIHLVPVEIQAVLTVLGRREETHRNDERHCLDLSRTDLRGVTLTGDLSGINFEAANLQYARLQHVDLTEANFIKANLELVRFENANLKNAKLESVNLHWAELIATNLFGAKLEKADFRAAKLKETNLSQSNLNAANFSRASLCTTTRATLQQANLTRADFSRVDLSEIILEGADLSFTEFGEANLSKAKMGRTKLEEAGLGKANLEKADLQESNLSRAWLVSTTFRGANFKKANLTEAYIRGTCFDVKTDFSSALNLTSEQVTSMNDWECATYPLYLEQEFFHSQSESESG